MREILSEKGHSKTRMHSSRMRSVHSSGCISGGCTWSRGCTWSQGGGVPGLWGLYLARGGAPSPGGCLLLGGVYLVRYFPPCGQTHACKNITFATSLRTVMTVDIGKMSIRTVVRIGLAQNVPMATFICFRHSLLKIRHSGRLCGHGSAVVTAPVARPTT